VVTSPEESFFVRAQIAFYASTPSYRPVMALHGWEETAERLSILAGRGKWDEMPGLIDDQIMAAFAVMGAAGHLPAGLHERYRGLADRLALYMPFVPGEKDEFWGGYVSEMKRLAE
jgi:hypothetical protein